MGTLTIDQMQLGPNAKAAAEYVRAAHPEACFTSGRRDLGGQARAMAANVIRYGSAWLRDTYRDPALVSLLMTYTEEHVEQCSEVKLLAKGFYDTLIEHYAESLTRFPHLRGDAFDCAWPRLGNGLIDRPRGEAICRTIEQVPVQLGLKMILKKEGRLEIIHAEFAHAVEAVPV
jgi:hypothetical protein